MILSERLRAKRHSSMESFSENVASHYPGHVQDIVWQTLAKPTPYKEDERLGEILEKNGKMFEVKPFVNPDSLKLLPSFVDAYAFLATFQSLNSPNFWNHILDIGDSRTILKESFGDLNNHKGINGSDVSYGNGNFYAPYLVFLGATALFDSHIESAISTCWQHWYPPTFIAARNIGKQFTQPLETPEDLKGRLLSMFLPYENMDCVAAQQIQKAQHGCPAPDLTATIFNAVGTYLWSEQGWRTFSQLTLSA
jgi:hypothetical protein